jgi:hypothetical protein
MIIGVATADTGPPVTLICAAVAFKPVVSPGGAVLNAVRIAAASAAAVPVVTVCAAVVYVSPSNVYARVYVPAESAALAARVIPANGTNENGSARTELVIGGQAVLAAATITAA